MKEELLKLYQEYKEEYLKNRYGSEYDPKNGMPKENVKKWLYSQITLDEFMEWLATQK